MACKKKLHPGGNRVATTASDYQQKLLPQFGSSVLNLFGGSTIREARDLGPELPLVSNSVPT